MSEAFTCLGKPYIEFVEVANIYSGDLIRLNIRGVKKTNDQFPATDSGLNALRPQQLIHYLQTWQRTAYHSQTRQQPTQHSVGSQ